MDEKEGTKGAAGRYSWMAKVASDGTNILALVAPETSKAARLCPGHLTLLS